MKKQISKLVLFVLFADLLHATTYHVIANTDTGAGAGNMGDLRYVIDQLNLPVLDPGSNIVFDLPLGMETITLTSPLPNLNLTFPNLVNIDGLSTLGPTVIIDGTSQFPGFVVDQIDSPGFTIQNLIMQNCWSIGANGAFPGAPGAPAEGGAIAINTVPMGPGPVIFQDIQLLNCRAIGGDGNQADGGPAEGGAVFSLASMTVQGSATFNGTIQSGNPPPMVNSTFGSSFVSFNLNPPLQLNPTLVTDTILFTDSFVILNDVEQNGPGTVTLQTTSTTPPAADFEPSVYDVFGAFSINQGTLNLNGTVTQIPSGALLPLPALGVFGPFNFAPGTTLSGTGLAFAGLGSTMTFQAADIRPAPGILFLLGDMTFGPGTNIYTSVEPTQTSSVSLSNFTFPSPPVDISNATLHVDIQAGSYTNQTVYALVLSAGLFQGQFQNIVVTNSSSLSNPTVVYSPLSAPNSVLLPVNVPFGVSTVDIVLGTFTFPSTVLYDPCAGIVVINLLAPGLGASALSAFFANQSVLTSQTLSAITTSLNAQCIKGKGSGSSNPQGALAMWNDNKHLLLVQNSFDSNPTPPARPKEEELNQEKKSFLPSILPMPKEAPLYSVSITPLAQFQNQQNIETWNASVPAYDTQTYGAILGFDYLGMETILVGGAATVAWTNLNVAENGGGQQIWSVFGTAYSSFSFGHLFFNLLATGSYNYNRAIRNFAPIPGEILTIDSVTPFGTRDVYTFQSTGIPGGTAHSKFNSYQLVPHFDLNYEIGFDWISLVPFVLSDCAISFSESIAETGENFLNVSACLNKVSLNIATDSLITFILQSEAGANLFEQIELGKDKLLVFRQKVSYVNRYFVPYTLRSKLLDSIEFTNTHLTLPMQHMFGCSAEMIYRWGAFATVVTYEGIMGSGFLSNAGYLRFSLDF